MKRAKYVCPKCGTVVEARWWNGVLGPECPNCNAIVLDTVKGKRFLLNLIGNFIIFFSGWLIMWFFQGTFEEKIALILLIGVVMVVVLTVGHRRLVRNFLAKE